MRFFEPSDEFLDWLADYAAGRPTFDVGCGDGHVLLALQARGVRAVGIDPSWRYAEVVPTHLCNCLLIGEAERTRILKSTPNSLVLFCRPCHSGFVARTLHVLPPDSEPLYISKPSNLTLDLPDFETEVVEAPACLEEVVYRVRLPHAIRRRS